jgi:hypothetical protein
MVLQGLPDPHCRTRRQNALLKCRRAYATLTQPDAVASIDYTRVRALQRIHKTLCSMAGPRARHTKPAGVSASVVLMTAALLLVLFGNTDATEDLW